MISSYLLGGLGNQMFQIATTYSLAKEMDVDYLIDFDLCHTPAQGNTSNKYKDNIFKNIKNGKVDTAGKRQHNEPTFSYVELPKQDDIILRGYFQSEKYFEKHSDYIKKFLFDFSVEMMDEVETYLDTISYDEQITAVHVRRGDYLKSPNFHPVCTIEYYKEAMEKIGGNFMFISDDIEWCKDNFKGDNIFFSPFTNELDDLYLMMSCENQIIANSSFSWWGTYLCRWDDNKVIAPSRWFGSQGPQDTQDIYLDNWIII